LGDEASVSVNLKYVGIKGGGSVDEQSIGLLEQVVGHTGSELILFFVVAAVAAAIVGLPLYRLVTNDRKNKHKHENERLEKYMEREMQILQQVFEVIRGNTEALSRLANTLERDVKSTATSLERVHDRIDEQGEILNDIKAALAALSRNDAKTAS